MTELNQNPMNTNQRSKAPLVLFIVCILVLFIVGGYFAFAESLGKTVESANDDVVSKVAQSNNTVEDNSATTNTTNEPTAADETIRDPNRCYNDAGGYSFVIPKGMQIRIPGNYSKKINKSTTEIASEFPVPVDAASDWLPFANVSISAPTQFTLDFTCSPNTTSGYPVKQCSAYSDLVDGSWYAYEIDALKDKTNIISITGADKKVIDDILNTLQVE